MWGVNGRVGERWDRLLAGLELNWTPDLIYGKGCEGKGGKEGRLPIGQNAICCGDEERLDCCRGGRAMGGIGGKEGGMRIGNDVERGLNWELERVLMVDQFG